MSSFLKIASGVLLPLSIVLGGAGCVAGDEEEVDDAEIAEAPLADVWSTTAPPPESPCGPGNLIGSLPYPLPFPAYYGNAYYYGGAPYYGGRSYGGAPYLGGTPYYGGGGWPGLSGYWGAPAGGWPAYGYGGLYGNTYAGYYNPPYRNYYGHSYYDPAYYGVPGAPGVAVDPTAECLPE